MKHESQNQVAAKIQAFQGFINDIAHLPNDTMLKYNGLVGYVGIGRVDHESDYSRTKLMTVGDLRELYSGARLMLQALTVGAQEDEQVRIVGVHQRLQRMVYSEYADYLKSGWNIVFQYALPNEEEDEEFGEVQIWTESQDTDDRMCLAESDELQEMRVYAEENAEMLFDVNDEAGYYYLTFSGMSHA